MEKLYLRSNSAVTRLTTDNRRPLYDNIEWTDPLIIVLGARGVGKTTLLLQRLAQLKLPVTEAMYVDMGDLYFQSNRLIDFVELFLAEGGRYLFIDEIHRYGFDTWAAEVKQVYDLYRDRLKLVITGSSIVRILSQQADLSRRALVYRLNGLSFREYLLLTEGIELPQLTLDDILTNHRALVANILQQVPTPLPRLRTYWQTGYYPFFLSSRAGYIDRLTTSVQTVLEYDLPHATDAPRVDTQKLARLLSTITASVPFTVNMEKIGQATGISRASLLRYFQLLDEAQLIHTLRNESRGLASMAKPDKLYLDNPNLLHALAPGGTNIGHLRETFFISQLRSLTQTKALVPPDIRLPRTGDFVILLPDGRKPLFEIGGPKKSFRQIGEDENHYAVVDTVATEHSQKIPLWLFGFLY